MLRTCIYGPLIFVSICSNSLAYDSCVDLRKVNSKYFLDKITPIKMSVEGCNGNSCSAVIIIDGIYYRIPIITGEICLSNSIFAVDIERQFECGKELLGKSLFYEDHNEKMSISIVYSNEREIEATKCIDDEPPQFDPPSNNIRFDTFYSKHMQITGISYPK